MPELPEVETVRRALERRVLGRVITDYEVGRPAFNRPIPAEALRGLKGSRITAVHRRGKYLLLHLSQGGRLVCHLGMSGSISFSGDEGHVRFRFTAGGVTVRIHDPRRFGRVGCRLPELGPEPLSPAFRPDSLFSALSGRRAPVKALLLDQAVVAGVGNIYATEALYRAGIRPDRPARRVTRAEAGRLCREIKLVLRRAIRAGGTTLNDQAFKDPEGRPGRFALMTAVYGRETGACGHALKATARPIAGRTSLYCPRCQA
ncbi:MAG: bifunctional DNA-formamidopyrimidine glycosylase/DNA-(apurinic or apyrimidinic site) lyase [Elusimicrobia bacterium]|nr:bifunctional DNA-formamidopyrimidine glycosylase/DNA-(apurinic or apyrimidinic site) lyase [Elusimicrobiota bacterium]